MSERGAGVYGPKTKAAFEEYITRKFRPEKASTLKASPNISQGRYFAAALAPKDKGEEVELLQEELHRLHFFGLPPTGYYGPLTEHAVLKFQQAFNIVQDEKSYGAGVAGPKTLEKLNELAEARQSQKKLIGQTTKTKIIVASRVEDEKVLLAGHAESGAFPSELAYGTRGQEVEQLQKTLKRLGFFQGRLTSRYFGDITKQSLIGFQRSHGLSESGVLDEPTRSMLNKLVGSA
ncbi:peptidoglycan-binding protein [Candidatus Peregrinibacteria bacterium]|nr:peptidoglycan-binding protein [Candidatus Peregrinibacteria bacterium]